MGSKVRQKHIHSMQRRGLISSFLPKCDLSVNEKELNNSFQIIHFFTTLINFDSVLVVKNVWIWRGHKRGRQVNDIQMCHLFRERENSALPQELSDEY